MNIAIVGKNSYIGTSFEKHISKSGNYNIITIDSRNTPTEEMNFKGMDVVLHVAGIAHVSSKNSMKDFYYKINRDLAIDTVKKAKEDGVKQFVFMSSMIIYGNDAKIGKSKIITDKTIPNPSNFYGQSKYDADLIIQGLNDDVFKTVVIRTPMVYGPNCKGNFPRLVKLARKTFVFPNIKNQRSMIYIDNLVEFIRMAIEHKSSGVFYPQNTEYVSTAEIIRVTSEFLEKKIWFTRVFNWLIIFGSIFMRTITKMFGSKVYDKELSKYFDNKYNIVDFKESIKKSIT